MFDSLSGFLVGFGLRRGWGRLGVVGVVVGVLASVLVVVPSGGVGAAGGVSAPSGLSAVSVEGGVLLSWDAPESGPSEVSGYRVFRRLPESGERRLSVLVSDTGSSETSFLDVSAVVEGELFVYRVAALFDGVVGEGSVRARVRYETPEAEPVLRAVDPEPEAEVEADADVVVLSGVLSVGSQGGVSPAMSGFSSWARAGSLSPRSFSVDGSAVRVLVLVEHAGGVFLATDQAMGSDFVLDVGGLEFVGSESLVPALPVRGAYWWPSGGLSWSDGDTVDVELRVAADAVPIGVRAAAPVWAYFDRVPDTHDGTSEFSVRLRFGEDVDTDAAALRDSIVVAAGGTVTAVEPAAGSTRNWTVTVVPDGDSDVTVSVGSGLSCADLAAVCTADGRTLPAGIEVTVAGPSAAVSLDALSLDGALLEQAFDPEVTLYTAQADAGISQVTVAGVARDAAASVDVLPADADPNAAGHQIAVTEGAQTAVAVTVTAADGDSLRRYWVVVDGPAEAGGNDVQEVPGLTGLALDGLASFGFTPAQRRYEAVKAAGVSMVTVIASSDDSDATVEVLVVRSDDSPLVIDTDDADPNTAGHQVALSEAGETLLLVLVTSADAKRQDVYLVLVRQPALQPPAAPGAPVTKNTVAPGLLRSTPGVALRDTAVPTLTALSLDGITLAPQFAAATTDYTATVDADTAQVTVTATPAGDATVMFTPADADLNTAGWQVALPAADAGGAPTQTNIAAIVTTADSMTVNAYLITVSREAPPADDATLTALVLDGATLAPAFDPATHSYTAEVGSDVDQVTLDLVTAAGATVTVVPGDDDSNTAGWQIPLADVQAGGEPSVTAVAVVVTAADGNTRLTYIVTVTRQAPSAPSPITAVLPEGCVLETLNAKDDGTFRKSGVWRPECQSIFEYRTNSDDPVAATGNARFYRLDVLGQGRVTIEVESDTSRHILLRSADGTLVKHTTYLIVPPSDDSCVALFGVSCSGNPVLNATLPTGSYIVETVQHYRDGRQRRSTVTVEGPNIYSVTPRLAALSVDGTSVAGFDYNTFVYELARQSATVTVAAEATAAPPSSAAHSVLIEPADADPDTAGHQVELAEYGLTEVTVTVTDGDGVGSNRYVVAFSGDHQATTSTSGSINVGGSVRARVDSNGDRDWFAVDLVADSTYRIDLKGKSSASGSLVDPHMFGVRLADGTLVAGTDDDNSGDGKNSALWFVASVTGTHFVDVGADGSGTGTYELSVTGLADDFAAGIVTAGAVVVDGTVVSGAVEFLGDRDWFAVVLAAGRTYVVALKGDSSGKGTLADPHLFEVRDASGAVVAGTADGDGGFGTNARAVFSPTVSGTYFVVAAARGDGLGTYELSVAGPADDFAASIVTAGAVAVDGAAVSGAVEFSGDRDWFAVTLVAGGVYVVALEGDSSSKGTLVDPHLFEVRDADGVAVSGTANGDAGKGKNAEVLFSPTVSGTYFVVAGTRGDGLGTYELSVVEDPAELSELSLKSITAVVTYGGYWVFLSPAFDASEVLYWSRPGYNRTLLTVTPVLRDPAATMRITPRDADVYAAGHQIRVAEGKQNALTVTVTSANGAVSRRHWVVFDGERVGDPDAETMPKLGGLELGGLGSLGFAKGQYRYEIDAVPGVTQATVIAVRDELRARVEVVAVRSDDSPLVFDAADADPSIAGHQVALSAAGETVVLVRIVSNDGRRQQLYTVVVRQPGTTATAPALSALGVAGATLAPQFAASEDSYTTVVDGRIEQVTVTATAAAGASVVLVPADADPNTAGHQVGVPAGVLGGEPAFTVVTAVVISADGTASGTYDVAVAREHAIGSLTLSDTHIRPKFRTDVLSYRADVGADVAFVTVEAPTNTGASVWVAPADAYSANDGHQVALTAGAVGGEATTTDIEVAVESIDGLVTTYAIAVTRAAQPAVDATLGALSIDGVDLAPTFAAGTSVYAATVASDVLQVTMNIETSDADATVEVSAADGERGTAGRQVLLGALGPDGSASVTSVEITVTAEDGVATRTYTVDITRTADTTVADSWRPDSYVDIGAVSTEPVITYGNISRVDEVDYYRVTLQGGQGYRVMMAGPGTGSVIWTARLNPVRDTDNQPVSLPGFLTNSSDPRSTIQYFVAPATGAYYIAAASQDCCYISYKTGRYRLHVSRTGGPNWDAFAALTVPNRLADVEPGSLTPDEMADLFERNDFAGDSTTSGRVKVGSYSYGFISGAGDMDYIRVELEADRLYAVEVQGLDTGNGTLADPIHGGMYTAGGTPWARDVNYHGGFGRDTLMVVSPETSGDHMISVLSEGRPLSVNSHYHHVAYTFEYPGQPGNYNRGSYRVVVRDITPDPPAETPDKNTPARVNADGVYDGAINKQWEHDWVGVELKADQPYRITVTSRRHGPLHLHGTAATVAAIRDSSGKIVYQYGTGGSWMGNISFLPVTDGLYFVEVLEPTRNSGNIGGYRLSVKETDEIVDPAFDRMNRAETVALGAVIEGDTYLSFNDEWYAVNLAGGTDYVVTVKGEGSNSGTLKDPYVRGIYRFAPAVAVADRTAEDVKVVLSGSSDLDKGGAIAWHTYTWPNGYVQRTNTGNEDVRYVFRPRQSGTYYFRVGNYMVGKLSFAWWSYLWGVPGTFEFSVTTEGSDAVVEETPVVDPLFAEIDADSVTALTLGTAADGEAVDEQTGLWFSVDLAEAGVYRVQVTPGTLRYPFIAYALDPDGVRLQGPPANGTLSASRILRIEAQSAGTYYIGVAATRGITHPDEEAVGAFSVTATVISPPPTPPTPQTQQQTGTVMSPFDDYPADDSTDGSVRVGGAATGGIDYRNDKDWFKVFLVADAVYTIALEDAGSDPLDDARLGGVYDIDGTLLSVDADYSGTADEDSELTFTATASGLHFVEAAGHVDADGWSTGTYRLTLAADALAATALTLGESAAGEITVAHAESHLYSVELEAGKDYWVQADAGTLEHPYLLRVYDADGVVVHDHSGEPSELGARIRRITAANDGAYFIVVAATTSLTNPDGVGTYRITVSDMSDSALTAVAGQTGVSALEVGAVQRSSIDTNQETDRYRVYLEAGVEYRIDMEGAWTGYRDANGSWIVTASLFNPIIEAVYHEDDTAADLIVGSGHHDAGVGQNSRVVFTPAADGFYLIDASAEQAWTGTYVLTVNTVS